VLYLVPAYARTITFWRVLCWVHRFCLVQALNDLFEKIMHRDIKERDLLRLGAGERDLDTDSDFSKMGRVNATLLRRSQVLAEVDRLGRSLAVRGDAVPWW
jgi:hypothetical protein